MAIVHVHDSIISCQTSQDLEEISVGTCLKPVYTYESKHL